MTGGSWPQFQDLMPRFIFYSENKFSEKFFCKTGRRPPQRRDALWSAKSPHLGRAGTFYPSSFVTSKVINRFKLLFLASNKLLSELLKPQISFAANAVANQNGITRRELFAALLTVSFAVLMYCRFLRLSHWRFCVIAPLCRCGSYGFFHELHAILQKLIKSDLIPNEYRWLLCL